MDALWWGTGGTFTLVKGDSGYAGGWWVPGRLVCGDGLGLVIFRFSLPILILRLVWKVASMDKKTCPSFNHDTRFFSREICSLEMSSRCSLNLKCSVHTHLFDLHTCSRISASSSLWVVLLMIWRFMLSSGAAGVSLIGGVVVFSLRRSPIYLSSIPSPYYRSKLIVWKLSFIHSISLFHSVLAFAVLLNLE